MSDNLEFTAGYILDLWQNNLYEFFCCDCFKGLKKQEMEVIERELKYRSCLYCDKTIDIYEFSKLHDYLKIKELKEMWLNENTLIFCNKICERKYFRDIRIHNQ
ncbi:MAG: hypothetical protein GF353_16835 [Candidatus Lokiarchaeota archaeon]|nr:hypothetical protein [Candidatus Lokiarchaeota archaeon]